MGRRRTKKIIKIIDTLDKLYYIEMEDGRQFMKLGCLDMPLEKIVGFTMSKNIFFGRLINRGHFMFQYLKDNKHIYFCNVSFERISNEYLIKIYNFLTEELNIKDLNKN